MKATGTSQAAPFLIDFTTCTEQVAGFGLPFTAQVVIGGAAASGVGGISGR
jgi:hypothetical protein